MNHSPQYHYKGLDADLDEYLSEYKNQTPLESDHYAGECCNYPEDIIVRPVIPFSQLLSRPKLLGKSLRNNIQFSMCTCSKSHRQVSFFSRTTSERLLHCTFFPRSPIGSANKANKMLLFLPRQTAPLDYLSSKFFTDCY